MAEPRKEYRARIWVRLTDDLLPSPRLKREELQAMLDDALGSGRVDSSVASVVVEDPRR
jgi:hypothetical protein